MYTAVQPPGEERSGTCPVLEIPTGHRYVRGELDHRREARWQKQKGVWVECSVMRLLVFLTAAVCLTSSWLATPCVQRRPAALMAATRVADITMKKGRAQGGGPKIATRKTRTKTEGERSVDKRAAQLARRVLTAKRRPTLAAGRQRDRFVDIVDDGAARFPVFARPAGEKEWLPVGHVSIRDGAETTAEQAATLQKRLIFEHAVRLHPPLQLHSDALECGLGAAVAVQAEATDANDAADVDADAVVPEPTLLASDAPTPTSAADILEAASTCGFLGDPLPAGHYFGDSSPEALQSDTRKVKLTCLGDDAKSAIAVQQTKTLGLRSLG